MFLYMYKKLGGEFLFCCKNYCEIEGDGTTKKRRHEPVIVLILMDKK